MCECLLFEQIMSRLNDTINHTIKFISKTTTIKIKTTGNVYVSKYL